MIREDRAYQARAIDGIKDEIRQDHDRVLLVAPTGAGKTTIAATIIEGATAKNKKTIFIAHRRELIDQCSARLKAQGVPHGVIMGKGHPRFNPLAPVQVASIATLRRRELPWADLVFIDEAHHARAETYEEMLGYYAGATVIGMTASPWRGDGRGLGDVFNGIVVASTPKELTGLGFLVPLTGFVYDTPDLARVTVKRTGDYDEKQSAAVMSAGAIVGNVVEQWLAHASGLSTVLFAVTVAHSQTLVEKFRAAGVCAEHVDGETPVRERAAILARLARGETQVLCNVGVLTEGWDCPRASCVILARPTKSLALYLQMVGRVLRPICFTCRESTSWKDPACRHCGSADVKRVARLHDHSGAVLALGLPDDERDYLLDTDPPENPNDDDDASDEGPLWRCLECFAVNRAEDQACAVCGALRPASKRKIKEKDGVAIPLEEIGARKIVPLAERKDYFDRMVAERNARGFKPGYPLKRYQMRFGQWPPSAWGAAAGCFRRNQSGGSHGG